jgi:uracil-DNA glycosylase
MDLNIPRSWQGVIGAEFDKPYFKSLARFVDDERQALPLGIFPQESQVFAALKLTPFSKIRVVILGQDPYPGEGMAHGLCFSVAPAVTKLPPSLRNIFRELQSDLGIPLPNNGCLTPWAKQGILMLNTILTLRAGKPLSHKGRGWETFTDEIIRKVSAKPRSVVFVLWGKTAQASLRLIDTTRHVIVQGAHPSPLSAKKFFGTRPFSSINAALREMGNPEIDWMIPNMVA